MLEASLLPENSVHGSPAVEREQTEIELSDYLVFEERNFGNVPRNNKVEVGFKVGFRTKSEVDILDDGFKWRKYGKKYLKNSPNPRNYYRCSNGGCQVKKRIERDEDDPRFVITTYVGVHNHESPCVVYYTPQPAFDLGSSSHIPLMAPSSWVLQASHFSSS